MLSRLFLDKIQVSSSNKTSNFSLHTPHLLLQILIDFLRPCFSHTIFSHLHGRSLQYKSPFSVHTGSGHNGTSLKSNDVGMKSLNPGRRDLPEGRKEGRKEGTNKLRIAIFPATWVYIDLSWVCLYVDKGNNTKLQRARSALFSLVNRCNEQLVCGVPTAIQRWPWAKRRPDAYGVCTVLLSLNPHSHPPHLWLRTDEQMQYVGTEFPLLKLKEMS